MEAYVLIECAPGKAPDALRKVAKVRGVDCALAVTGPYDIIAYIEYKNQNDLGRIVCKGIQKAPGVARTITCQVVGL